MSNSISNLTAINNRYKHLNKEVVETRKRKSQQETTRSNQGEGFFRQEVATLKFLLSEARTSHTLRPSQVRNQVSHQLPLSEEIQPTPSQPHQKVSRTNQSSPRDREYFETEAVLLKFRAEVMNTQHSCPRHDHPKTVSVVKHTPHKVDGYSSLTRP
mgnify:CR=1 FL=1